MKSVTESGRSRYHTSYILNLQSTNCSVTGRKKRQPHWFPFLTRDKHMVNDVGGDTHKSYVLHTGIKKPCTSANVHTHTHLRPELLFHDGHTQFQCDTEVNISHPYNQPTSYPCFSSHVHVLLLMCMFFLQLYLHCTKSKHYLVVH